jgi:hypothetical protein
MDTFVCGCGDYEYPLVESDDGDEYTWCECGLRIDQQREFWIRNEEY